MAERLQARLKARRGNVVADDERSESPGLYVLVGLISIALMALFLAFLVVPPAFAAHCVIAAQRSGRSWLGLVGGLLMIGWLIGLLRLGRRVMGPGPGPVPAGEDPPESES